VGVALLGPLLAVASYPAGSATDAALVSDPVLIDEDEDRIARTPESGDGEHRVILPPGGQVEPQACAPPARLMAEAGVATWILQAPLDLLLPDANGVELPGGNHAQFGDYGPQDSDGTTTIAPDEQWTLDASEPLALFDR
jgi:hypothetical protein